MDCSECGKPVVLVPSAIERSRKTGEPPAFYTQLFTTHTDCFLKKRRDETSALMRRLRNEV